MIYKICPNVPAISLPLQTWTIPSRPYIFLFHGNGRNSRNQPFETEKNFFFFLMFFYSHMITLVPKVVRSVFTLRSVKSLVLILSSIFFSFNFFLPLCWVLFTSFFICEALSDIVIFKKTFLLKQKQFLIKHFKLSWYFHEMVNFETKINRGSTP